MAKSMKIDFNKSYDELSQEAQSMLSEQDFNEIKNMLCYRSMMTESIRKATGHKDIKKPVNINKAISLVNSWQQALKNSSPEGCENWIKIIQNSDNISKLEMQVVMHTDDSHPVTLKCAGYPKDKVIDFIRKIYNDGSYIKSIKM